MYQAKNIRDLDGVSEQAKEFFALLNVPVILRVNQDLDAEKLTKFCLNFFDIFCDLNQVSAWHKDFTDNRKMVADTRKQWQYYAAFFYHKLSSDENLDCSYTPEELEYLGLKMTCASEDTFGLSHDRAIKLIGTIIKESMERIRINFDVTPIGTDNIIPEFNRYDSSKLMVQDGLTSPSRR